jgi:hypothetical protein
MAREVIVRMTDDFDRSQTADEVVEFVYEGVRYTLDLTTDHANEFRAYIQPYIDAAHEAQRVTVAEKVSKTGAAIGTRRTQMRSPEGEPTEVREAIRKWASDNGYEVQPRGIIKQEIRDAYTLATGIPVGRNVKMRVDEVDTSQLTLDGKHHNEAPNGADEGRAARPKPSGKAHPAGKANAHGITPEMREWARENGVLGNRGYIAKEHRDRYHNETAVQAAAAEALSNVNVDNHTNGVLL